MPRFHDYSADGRGQIAMRDAVDGTISRFTLYAYREALRMKKHFKISAK